MIYAAARDISARKELEAEREALILELERRNVELERFTYTVSHDLRSPLVTIAGFLGYLKTDLHAGDVDRAETDIARIAQAVDKMQRLLRELLDLSRVGRVLNPPQTVAFGAVVDEARRLVEGRIDARGVRLEVAADLPLVHCDRARMVEVVQNLIDNACKFMGEQPEPRIDVGQQGCDQTGKPILFVRDNGTGIDPSYHERVFGLFEKLDAGSEGTGIGLALVKRIVESHGGRIWVESALGKGSTFYFTVQGPPGASEAAPASVPS
jgi:signal transduction histidine kinase